MSELNECVRDLIEDTFPLLWVEGELSNLARPVSGHLYFSLKDERSQIRCAMFRNRNKALKFRPETGQQVRAKGRVSVYLARGDYQLIVEAMELAGDGALQKAFEALRRRLQAEGLFDSALKRPLPLMPRRVGVITSSTGAALRDILSVFRRRFPALRVLVYPSAVQGPDAAQSLAEAVNTAGRIGDCDLLILARGGGSLEDLWAFNDETLARAIRACPIPTVSGIGHETDMTIADFAVDMRAATPSAAAELVSPLASDWIQRFSRQQDRLTRSLLGNLGQLAQRVDWLERQIRVQHPGRRLKEQQLRLEHERERLARALEHRLMTARIHCDRAQARLLGNSPQPHIERCQLACQSLARRLGEAVQGRLRDSAQRLAMGARALQTVSPLGTLGRGYAIVSRVRDSSVVLDTRDVEIGEKIEARLAKGRLICAVDERIPAPGPRRARSTSDE